MSTVSAAAVVEKPADCSGESEEEFFRIPTSGYLEPKLPVSHDKPNIWIVFFSESEIPKIKNL